jgi:hypothetical protein
MQDHIIITNTLVLIHYIPENPSCPSEHYTILFANLSIGEFSCRQLQVFDCPPTHFVGVSWLTLTVQSTASPKLIMPPTFLALNFYMNLF